MRLIPFTLAALLACPVFAHASDDIREYLIDEFIDPEYFDEDILDDPSRPQKDRDQTILRSVSRKAGIRWIATC